MKRTLIRYEWPAHTRCPNCGSDRWNDSGRSRRVQYRRCKHCRSTYKVCATHGHYDTGGMQSEILEA